MKNMLRVMLAVLLCLGVFLCLCASADAETGGAWGDLTWMLNDDGLLSISGEAEMPGGMPNDLYQARDKIRSVVFENGVKSIANMSFSACNRIKSVYISGSVKHVGMEAFRFCENLEKLIIENGVEIIDEHAFTSCSNLRDFTFPESVTFIGWGAIGLCYQLKNVTFPSKLDKISEFVCSACTGLEYVKIQEGAKLIDDGAFNDCESLKYVVIPKSVACIKDSAFRGCSSLSDVYYSGTEEQWQQIIVETDNEPLNKAHIHFQAPDRTYAVTYEANGGVNAPAPQEKTKGSPLVLSTVVPTRASSVISRYTVTLDANGGAVSPASLSAAETEEYIFTGWNTFSYGAGDAYAPGSSYDEDQPVTLYAQWYPETKTEAVSLPVPVREDYLFKGWSENLNADSGYTGKYIPNKAVLLHAIWEPQFLAKGTWGELTWKLDADGSLTISGKGAMDAFGSDSVDAWRSYTESIRTVEISEGVDSIGEYAFSNCTNLKQANIPLSVKAIGKAAFNGCSGLETAEIPAGVANISSTAFAGCSSLTAFAVDENNPQYCDIDGVLFNKQGNTLLCCPCGKAGVYAISENVTEIGNYAFFSCSGLTNVTIPESVTSIGNYAFAGCLGLQSVTVPGNGTNIGSAAFVSCDNLKSVTLGDGVEGIGSMAFANCSSLESITIPGNVTSIGSFAFYNCSGLNALYINDLAAWCALSFKEMSYSNPLQYAHNLYLNEILVVDMVIPEGVTSISPNTFVGCNSLKSVIIPGSVQSIGDYAFAGCSSLTDVKIMEGVTSIGERTFYNCSSLKNVELSSGVTSIGYNAFYGCGSLASITIPASMENVGGNAFAFSGLTNLTLQEGLASIGEYAFSYCSALASVTIPGSVKNIERGAFSTCNHLSSVKIMEGVTSIGEYAFDGCIEVCDGDGLKSLIIPKSVVSIENSAFRDCEFLTDIFYAGSQEEWNHIAIGDNNTPLFSATKHYDTPRITPDLTLPAALTTIESKAFAGGGFASVLIPPTVTTIAPDAFGDRTELIILGTSGSYAETFAGLKHFTFVPAA